MINHNLVTTVCKKLDLKTLSIFLLINKFNYKLLLQHYCKKKIYHNLIITISKKLDLKTLSKFLLINKFNYKLLLQHYCHKERYSIMCENIKWLYILNCVPIPCYSS
jgi:hypothetical protein